MLKRLPPVLLFDKLWNECGMLASWSPRRLEKLVRVSLYMRMEQRTKFIQNSLIFARFYWLLHVTWCKINRPRTTSIFIIRLFPSERKKIEKKAWLFFQNQERRARKNMNKWLSKNKTQYMIFQPPFWRSGSLLFFFFYHESRLRDEKEQEKLSISFMQA